MKRAILFLCSKLYELLISARNRLYDYGIFKTQNCALPVISVGNLTAGGNSKTPLCILIWQELKKRGYRPVVLSRGYGGRSSKPRVVHSGDDVMECGDEALMMTRLHGIQVVTARRRIEGACLIAEQDIGDVIILDDGFQHRALARELDIVCVNAASPAALDEFGRGDLLPLGRFREEKSAALRRAHVIVFAARGPMAVQEDALNIASASLPGNVLVVRTHISATAVTSLDGTRKLEGGEAVAFCGIANPEGFFSTLGSLGFRIRSQEVFVDHHVFTNADIARLTSKFAGLPLICTEKDSMKIDEGVKNVYVLRVRCELEHGEKFWKRVEEGLKR